MKLNHFLNRALTLCLCLAAFACEDKDDAEKFTPTAFNVSGKAETGPFDKGSTITLQPLDAKLTPVGEAYTSAISDNIGGFSFGSKEFTTPYAELVAEGYFLDEMRDNSSKNNLNLRAMADLRKAHTVNVNVLTHLKHARVSNLVASGKNFAKADKQAQEEVLAAFGLARYADTDVSQFSIMAGTDESAALIAVSSLLYLYKSKSDFIEYLEELSREFGKEGSFGAATRELMKEDRECLLTHNLLKSIRESLIEDFKELGISIEVKDLYQFFDWDDDGIAGNEALKEGETVKLSKTELSVPNEGGTYTIEITAPIQLYTEPQIPGDIVIGEPKLQIYEGVHNPFITIEKEVVKNKLTLTVAKLNSQTDQTKTVTLYDHPGNVMATLKVTQAGNNDVYVPLLAEDGRIFVKEIAYGMAAAFADLNHMEQNYHYNKEAELTRNHLYPEASKINDIWENIYRANASMLTFKYFEEKQWGVYQHLFNVFSTIIYYNMVVYWGDVPYITDRSFYDDFQHTKIRQTPANEILDDLTEKLTAAIGHLEEKKNEPIKDENGFFFVSKDVARILLADIYLYRSKYNEAEQLLSQVMQNGYYKLDASNYNQKETIDNLWNNGAGTETIFATKCKDLIPYWPWDGVIITIPSVIPLMNQTAVTLTYAECLAKVGNTAKARENLDKVITAKGIELAYTDVLTGIKEARKQLLLHSIGNFAFMKRNGLAQEEYGVEDYKLLLPIPWKEMNRAPNVKQNPGY